jgi:hypothetical protein
MLPLLLVLLLPITAATTNELILVGNTWKSEVTDHVRTILCQLRTQIIYFYFEHDLETDLHNDLLDSLNKCQVATIEIFA